ncbi:pyridoxal-phosphate dependent enzyme [Dyella tabacisoli]|uniref:Pyridoxal-phosphate dependent enzyme n=1 Tax=Dyella tabacisoli TaxID=2282381 RepID=A0A369US19_9GAMM|nr:pyridoxal-phosphate dependent enzyme [Dyella tabacisoli]RDD83267.1 pyridoxal-phosphate dependent enzyme [Dyella tabacisoli]
MTETLYTSPASETAYLWENYRPTGLIELPALARLTKVGRVFVKAEGERPLGNFKALGGMVAGLRALARAAGVATLQDLNQVDRESLPRLICASDGNHGLAVAAAAKRAGTSATIYLPIGVSQVRAKRIEAFGGDVVWIPGTYDDAVHSAAAAVARGEGLLIADTSTNPNDVVVQDVMAGYALITHELIAQFRDDVKERPSHVFVQAGVGGLAAAMAAGLWDLMQEPKRLLIVEPESAACVAQALAAGHPVRIVGALQTSAEMLSCGLASAPALEILQQHDARSVVIDESQLQMAAGVLREVGGPATTPSGAAGLAGLLHVAAHTELRVQHRLDTNSKVLLVVTEGLVTDSR